MSANPRVLLMQLSERTSAKGNRYFSGWLGKARVVVFQADEPDKYGNPQWSMFLSEPEAKPEQRQPPTAANQSASGPTPLSARELPADRAPAGRQGDGWRPAQYRRPAGGHQKAAT